MSPMKYCVWMIKGNYFMAYKEKVFKKNNVWYVTWLTPSGWKEMSCPSFNMACKILDDMYWRKLSSKQVVRTEK